MALFFSSQSDETAKDKTEFRVWGVFTVYLGFAE
jgi:hypothetical protein